MTENNKQRLLRQEYFHLHNAVQEFDGKALTIKTWSVTVSMAGIGAAYLEEVPQLFLLSGLSALLFWMVEAIWKAFQLGFFARIDAIEHAYFSESEDIKVGQIRTTWKEKVDGRKKLLKCLYVTSIKPEVWLPHLVVFLAGLILAALYAWPR